MQYRRQAVLLAVAILGFAGTARAGCAGLSSGAISAKFSEAMGTCERAAPAAAEPIAITPNASPIVVVAPPADLPTSVRVPFSVTRPATARGSRNRGDSTLLAVASRHRIDPLLLHSIIAKESAFRPGAVSNKGALGLMQIMPGTARGLGVRDPSRLLVDQELNLITGATYLKQLQRQFGNNVPAVLAAYNAGPGAVKRYRGTPPYAETRNYVKTIMKRYRGARGERTAR